MEQYLKHFRHPIRRPALQEAIGTMRANDVIREFVKREWIVARQGAFELTGAGQTQYNNYLGVK